MLFFFILSLLLLLMFMYVHTFGLKPNLMLTWFLTSKIISVDHHNVLELQFVHGVWKLKLIHNIKGSLTPRGTALVIVFKALKTSRTMVGSDRIIKNNGSDSKQLRLSYIQKQDAQLNHFCSGLFDYPEITWDIGLGLKSRPLQPSPWYWEMRWHHLPPHGTRERPWAHSIGTLRCTAAWWLVNLTIFRPM